MSSVHRFRKFILTAILVTMCAFLWNVTAYAAGLIHEYRIVDAATDETQVTVSSVLPLGEDEFQSISDIVLSAQKADVIPDTGYTDVIIMDGNDQIEIGRIVSSEKITQDAFLDAASALAAAQLNQPNS